MALVHVKPHRFTTPEFERLVESGFFGRNPRLELIEGEIVPMPAMNTPHGNGIMFSTNELVRVFGDTHLVRVQCPINLTLYSQPQPDFALIRKGGDVSSHPATADLVIEVSDTSLAYDRDEKASLYAAAGIQEVWILNVLDRRLEVMREPARHPGRTFEHAYTTVSLHGPDESVSPLFHADRRVRVGDMLGPNLGSEAAQQL